MCATIRPTRNGPSRTSNIGRLCCFTAQAATLATLEESGPAEALQEMSRGLQVFRDLFAEYDAEEQFEDDELVQRLIELRDTLREQYDLKPSLSEQLADAVAAEQYELAAKLRDELSRKKPL